MIAYPSESGRYDTMADFRFGPPTEGLIESWGTEGTGGQDAWELVEPAMVALDLLHCKNIELAAAPQDYPRRVRRRLERKGQKPPEHHVLLVDGKHPLRLSAPAPDDPDAGPQVAHHRVRGHFATYTEERPLFGKYSGRFWIPPHVRGSRQVGEVTAEYQVEDGRDA